MKEVSDIIRAFRSAEERGKAAALATVVAVEGSSYRREGARMLVDEDGLVTGAISGGCLEGDALRRARLVMSTAEPLLVTYDTTDQDDASIGVQLGCNGIVHILIEPLHSDDADNPIALLAILKEKRAPAVLVTFFSFKDRKHPAAGTKLLLRGEESWSGLLEDPLRCAAAPHGEALLSLKGDQKSHYQRCGEITAFFEYIEPAVALLIVGAGNDAIPLQQMAALLGWDVTVIDGRPGHATRERFPSAFQVLVARAEDALSNVFPDSRTALVLMSHNYHYDKTVLQRALSLEFPYIGSLGPRRKLLRMLEELREEGLVIPEQTAASLFGPVGIDIGSETPEEIALSIVAEIKAVFSFRIVPSLREKKSSIHSY